MELLYANYHQIQVYALYRQGTLSRVNNLQKLLFLNTTAERWPKWTNLWSIVLGHGSLDCERKPSLLTSGSIVHHQSSCLQLCPYYSDLMLQALHIKFSHTPPTQQLPMDSQRLSWSCSLLLVRFTQSITWVFNLCIHWISHKCGTDEN